MLTTEPTNENAPEFWRSWYTRSGRRLSLMIILVVVAFFGSVRYTEDVVRDPEGRVNEWRHYRVFINGPANQLVAVEDLSEIDDFVADIASCQVVRGGPTFAPRTFWHALVMPAVPQLRYETHVVWKDEMDAMKWGLSSAIASNVEVLSRAIQTYNEKKANGVVVDATRPVTYEEWLHPGLAACVVVYWLLCLGLVWSLLAFITSSFVEPSNYRPRAGQT